MHNFVLVKCLSSRKLVTRSMSELVYVLYGLSEAEVTHYTNMHMSCPLPLPMYSCVVE